MFQFILQTVQAMSISDLIAILIALLSAVYTRYTWSATQDANKIAKKANEIAVQNNLRPSRLEVYRTMTDFAQYCSTYWTHWHLEHLGPVKGTRDLVERIESLKWEIEQQGPLNMPDIEAKAVEFQRKAWQMQRLLDRLAVGQNNPEDHAYQSGEENMIGLVEWFANERRELRATFQAYLSEAQSQG